MPLDEFRTQVLLLHSEQSTLDNLSSGFSETYTVHCATSGSEALNTLGETQIDVIVSAQELPGMSGLEALREAKKRSPDTIGILLAGSTDDGLEALVGDKEVFRVVRGTVSGEAILELVDEATQQVRLMTLAKSANDTAANVDEAAPEHIVMETAENGSAVVSDGSERLPALDSGRFSSISAVGSQDVDLLVLTKDQEFLATVKESSRGMHTVHYANTLAQAVDALNSHGVGVAVVDAAMVGDKVEQLAQHLRKISQRLVCIVAGRRDDGEMLMDLINRGKVYRFLLKPVSPGRARLAVEASVKHHLEAPDAAFKTNGGAATPSPNETLSTPAIDIETQPAAPPQVQSAPDVDRPVTPQSSVSTDPAESTSSASTSTSTIDDDLEDAFDDSEQGFAATVTGMLSSVRMKSPVDMETTTRSLKATSSGLETTPTVSGFGGPLWRSPAMLAGIGVAVIAIAGGMFWLSSGPDESGANTSPVVAPPAVTAAEVNVETPASETAIVANRVIDEARAARDAGQIVSPESSNAIELYMAAATAEPDNATIIAELDAVIIDALAVAETAMLESRIDDADTALQRIAAADPDNARLPFLTTQLAQIQMRGYLTNARSAILESRFEDASSALESARLLNIADTTELDTVARELDAARGEQASEEILAMAHARLDDDALLSPANDNARYFFELVLENDPENATALQGLTLVASKLALQARVDIDNGYLDSAEELLGAANSLDPSNNEALAAAAALSSKRDAVTAQRRAREEQLAAEEAARQAEEQRAAEAAAQPAAEQADEEARALVENASITGDAQAGATNDENNEVAAAVDDGVADTATAANTADQPTVEKPAPAKSDVAESRNTPPEATLTAVSTLSRTKYVAPRYPRAAQRRDISGWVDVAFTVTTDGTVKDVEVRKSEPGDTFVNAAINAVEKWEFEPVVVDGDGVEKRAGVRMMFALE
ncbi:MAG: TonB family protein [Gammaproteobacteria bacterium]|nr:TonB family protein [Gammaproteobacteria bacterium]